MIGERAENETYKSHYELPPRENTSEYLGFVAHETFGDRVHRVKDQ